MNYAPPLIVDLYVRSSRSDQYPYHSGKGTSVCQCRLYSLTYDDAEVIDDDNFATAALIRFVQKLSVEPIVLVKFGR